MNYQERIYTIIPKYSLKHKKEDFLTSYMFQKGCVLNGTYPFQWLDLHGAVNSGIMVGWYYWPTQVKKQILSNGSTNFPCDFKSMFLGEIYLPWYYIIKIVKLNLEGNMRKGIGVWFLHRWMQIDFNAKFECRVL